MFAYLSFYGRGLNSLLDDEYVKLIASLESNYIKDFQCNYCLDTRTELQRKHKGCHSYNHPREYKSNNVTFTTCVGNKVNNAGMNYWSDLYTVYKDSGEPIESLPAKKIEVFNVIASLILKKENERAEQQNKKRRR